MLSFHLVVGLGVVQVQGLKSLIEAVLMLVDCSRIYDWLCASAGEARERPLAAKIASFTVKCFHTPKPAWHEHATNFFYPRKVR